MKRAEWDSRRRAWASAMQGVASKLGEHSPLYKAMGSLAWGRYQGEPSATDNKDMAVFGCAYVQGKRDALLAVARMLGWDGARELEGIHVTVNERLSK